MALGLSSASSSEVRIPSKPYLEKSCKAISDQSESLNQNRGWMHMPRETFGEALKRPPQEEITAKDSTKPGLGWKVSDEARREIEEIEANIRAAAQRSGSVVLG